MVECIRARAGSLRAAPGPVATEMQWLPEPQTRVKPSAAPLLWSACSFTVGKAGRQSRMQWGGADRELSCAVECPPFVVSQRVVVINNSGRGFHYSICIGGLILFSLAVLVHGDQCLPLCVLRSCCAFVGTFLAQRCCTSRKAGRRPVPVLSLFVELHIEILVDLRRLTTAGT